MSGTQIMASAASFHSTPVVVLTPMYKLTPMFPENDPSFNLLVNPDAIISFDDAQMVEQVINPLYDYVPPNQVSLLITNAYEY
jgi:translation initiation factor eIF-2B subunit beta